MSRRAVELTDEQWLKLESLIPKPKPAKKGGRMPVPDCRFFEGIPCVYRSGARGKDVPTQYPSPATCCRRLQEWGHAGVWLQLWRKFFRQLDEKGILSWDQTCSDVTFSPTKAGVARVQSRDGEPTTTSPIATPFS